MRQRLSASALPLGSAGASALNFISFVLLPAHVGTGGLEVFSKDNYLGGLYLAAVVSSVAPIGVFVLAFGRVAALRHYITLSALGLLVVTAGGWPLFGTSFSLPCLAGALCMHVAGFLLAALIYQGQLWRAAALQVLQPLVFVVLLSSATLWTDSGGGRWSVLYLVSTLVCVAGFMLSTDWSALRNLLREVPTQSVGLRSMALRMLLCVSFAVFFQLELMVCGELTSIHLGDYTVLQKLYSSVSTSLLGSLGTLVLARQARAGQTQQAVSRQSLALSLACAAAVLAVGGLIALMGRKSVVLELTVIAGCSVVALLFTLASFANLTMQSLNPKISLTSLLIALVGYGALFALWRPSTPLQLLGASGAFFALFLATALGISERRSSASSSS